MTIIKDTPDATKEYCNNLIDLYANTIFPEESNLRKQYYAKLEKLEQDFAAQKSQLLRELDMKLAEKKMEWETKKLRLYYQYEKSKENKALRETVQSPTNNEQSTTSTNTPLPNKQAIKKTDSTIEVHPSNPINNNNPKKELAPQGAKASVTEPQNTIEKTEDKNPCSNIAANYNMKKLNASDSPEIKEFLDLWSGNNWMFEFDQLKLNDNAYEKLSNVTLYQWTEGYRIDDMSLTRGTSNGGGYVCSKKSYDQAFYLAPSRGTTINEKIMISNGYLHYFDFDIKSISNKTMHLTMPAKIRLVDGVYKLIEKGVIEFN